MPRRSVSEALDTRRTILDRAVDVASREGLEGMTIGGLADDLSMSKAGVIGHFGSKQELQLAALEEASEIFIERVWRPAEHFEPGLPRLLAICESWTGYLCGNCFAGGCFLTQASVEFDARPGPLRDAIAASLKRWYKVLAREVRAAVKAGDLPADTDPEQIVFELAALAVAANQSIQLYGDRRGAERALKAMRRVLGA